MQKILSSSLMFLIIFIHGLHLYANPSSVTLVQDGEIGLITAVSGLVMREAPGVHSEKLAVIPYNSLVKIHKFSDKEETILGITASWAYVEYLNYKGWSFSGFIKNKLTTDFKKIKTFHTNPFTRKKIALLFSNSLKDDIIKNFGTPKKTTFKKLQNLHALSIQDQSSQDTEYTLHYKGYKFIIYHVTSNNKQMLTGIIIDRNTEPLKYGIKIGSTSTDLFSKFGYPVNIVNSGISYRYMVNDYWGTLIDFDFKNNKLVEISIMSIPD